MTTLVGSVFPFIQSPPAPCATGSVYSAQYFEVLHFPFSLRRGRPTQWDLKPGRHDAATFIFDVLVDIPSFLRFEAHVNDHGLKAPRRQCE